MAPITRIGAYALVTSAAGKLKSNPNNKPISQPGQPTRLQHPMTKPIPNRLMNAPSKAARLSGNEIGNIKATEIDPKTRPLIKPSITFDIVLVYSAACAPLNLNRNSRSYSYLCE
jgi:hypothetical protein